MLVSSPIRDLVSKNVFMVQGGDNAESKGVVLLTVPSSDDADSFCDGYSILRLLKDGRVQEETKE